MQNWFREYWTGKRSAKEAFLVWGISANIMWHLCVCCALAYYFWAGIYGGDLPENLFMPPAVFVLGAMLFIGLLQALICMPVSLKILSVCIDDDESVLIKSSRYVFAIYGMASFFIGVLMLVLMPIWWNS